MPRFMSGTTVSYRLDRTTVAYLDMQMFVMAAFLTLFIVGVIDPPSPPLHDGMFAKIWSAFLWDVKKPTVEWTDHSLKLLTLTLYATGGAYVAIALRWRTAKIDSVTQKMFWDLNDAEAAGPASGRSWEMLAALTIVALCLFQFNGTVYGGRRVPLNADLIALAFLWLLHARFAAIWWLTTFKGPPPPDVPPPVPIAARPDTPEDRSWVSLDPVSLKLLLGVGVASLAFLGLVTADVFPARDPEGESGIVHLGLAAIVAPHPSPETVGAAIRIGGFDVMGLLLLLPIPFLAVVVVRWPYARFEHRRGWPGVKRDISPLSLFVIAGLTFYFAAQAILINVNIYPAGIVSRERFGHTYLAIATATIGLYFLATGALVISARRRAEDLNSQPTASQDTPTN
jgi:hypothetical protein